MKHYLWTCLKFLFYDLALAECAITITTVRNVVAARLCFHRHLWFCSWGVCVEDTPLGRHPTCADFPPGRHPPGRQPTWADTPLGRYTTCADTPNGRSPPPRRLQQRTVRILLECIVVFLKIFFQSDYHVLLSVYEWHFSHLCFVHMGNFLNKTHVILPKWNREKPEVICQYWA